MAVSKARRAAHRHTTLPTISEKVIRRKLFVDISVFSVHDAGTGIQRVVREVMSHLCVFDLEDYDVIPIAAKPNKIYKTAAWLSTLGSYKANDPGLNISPRHGDIFLGLDLSAHILPRHWAQILNWKRTGVRIHIVVYDLLPVLRPEWFTAKAVRNFRNWLETVAIFADRFHCISNTVKSELHDWMEDKYGILLPPNAAYVFPLGSSLKDQNDTKNSNEYLTESEDRAIEFAREVPSVLMVGTIEPRKGHVQVLNTFLKLWAKGLSYRLIIVGAPGWKTEDLQKLLCDMSANHTNLLWLKNAKDCLLEKLYQTSIGVIAASQGEGYGLPLIEADSFDKPVFSRDTPIFREVARRSVTFFQCNETDDLPLDQLVGWLESIQLKSGTNLQPLVDTSWHTTSSVLLANIGRPI